jgi:hypothetical protein
MAHQLRQRGEVLLVSTPDLNSTVLPVSLSEQRAYPLDRVDTQACLDCPPLRMVGVMWASPQFIGYPTYRPKRCPCYTSRPGPCQQIFSSFLGVDRGERDPLVLPQTRGVLDDVRNLHEREPGVVAMSQAVSGIVVAEGPPCRLQANGVPGFF